MLLYPAHFLLLQVLFLSVDATTKSKYTTGTMGEVPSDLITCMLMKETRGGSRVSPLGGAYINIH